MASVNTKRKRTNIDVIVSHCLIGSFFIIVSDHKEGFIREGYYYRKLGKIYGSTDRSGFRKRIGRQIVLTPRKATLVLQYSIGIRIRTTLSKKGAGKVRGKLESPLAVETDQVIPFYRLLLPSLFFERQYVMICDPSAGNWTVEGLHQWAKSLT